ncbi:signal recognition particle receptor FtsY [Alphaproteobacteria bacterium]|nr:signal recognition particle receptor FtsY [Alphaproteobacteria bacterium]
MSFFKKFSTAISKIRGKAAFDVAYIEDILIEADFGIGLAARLASAIGSEAEILEKLKANIEAIVASLISDLKIDNSKKPFVIVLCGVNGSGKTTTVAKLAHLLTRQGNTVDIVACDTFRIAATEQLTFWAEKLRCRIFKSDSKREPASLAFDAIERTKSDVLIVDTAGRLQNNSNLMDELAKLYRVLGRFDASAPHMNILIIDATSGQNVIEQVEEFQKVRAISGIIIAKMDGAAKGGTIVRIADEFKLQILGVGTGEKEFDLERFSIDKFLKDLAKL